MWQKIKQRLFNIWRHILLIDWSGLIIATLKTIKINDQKIDPKYIIIKPRILSEERIIQGLSALRIVLTFVPPVAIVAPLLGLGEMGFNIWKRITLGIPYDTVKFPPMDPNIMRMSIQLDEELNKHYGELILSLNWGSESIQKLEIVYNDFSFITNQKLLQSKYPQVDVVYIKEVCLRNKKLLGENLYIIEQEIKKVSHNPEVEYNLKDALEALTVLFPAMRDWSMFNSEGFNEIIDIIDIIF